MEKEKGKFENEKTKVFRKSEIFNQFTNIGNDEEGGPIGNCTKCGCKGTYIMEHKCSKWQDEGTQQSVFYILIN